MGWLDMKDRIRRVMLPNGDWVWGGFSHPAAKRAKALAAEFGVLAAGLRKRHEKRMERRK